LALLSFHHLIREIGAPGCGLDLGSTLEWIISILYRSVIGAHQLAFVLKPPLC